LGEYPSGINSKNSVPWRLATFINQCAFVVRRHGPAAMQEFAQAGDKQVWIILNCRVRKAIELTILGRN